MPHTHTHAPRSYPRDGDRQPAFLLRFRDVPVQKHRRESGPSTTVGLAPFLTVWSPAPTGELALGAVAGAGIDLSQAFCSIDHRVVEAAPLLSGWPPAIATLVAAASSAPRGPPPEASRKVALGFPLSSSRS